MPNKYEAESRAAQLAAKKLRACDSKRAFDTEAEAKCKDQQTYLCPFCGKWHRSASFQRLVEKLRKQDGPS